MTTPDMQNSADSPDVVQSETLLHIGQIRRLLPRIDYQDTFSAPLPEGYDMPLHALAHAMFAHPPKLLFRLMQLRDLLVAPLGLKTAKGTNMPKPGAEVSEPAIGDRIGIFKLVHKEDDLLLFKESDSHLDFVIALERKKGETGTSAPAGTDAIALSTCVRFNNATGRAYFFVVRPFHKWIVPMCMRDGLQRLK